jgi:hypothetical protein
MTPQMQISPYHAIGRSCISGVIGVIPNSPGNEAPRSSVLLWLRWLLRLSKHTWRREHGANAALLLTSRVSDTAPIRFDSPAMVPAPASFCGALRAMIRCQRCTALYQSMISANRRRLRRKRLAKIGAFLSFPHIRWGAIPVR